MASGSFKRKVKISDNDAGSTSSIQFEKSLPVSGWKPSIHSVHGMVSSGIRQLDDMINGGYSLGSIVLYEIDSFSDFGKQMLAYNIAEGISHRHKTIIFSKSEYLLSDLLQTLPYNQNVGTDKNANNMEQISGSSTMWDLKIAWQYAKYLKNKTQDTQENISNNKNMDQLQYCCSYDLSRSLQTDLLQDVLQIELFDASPFESVLQLLLSRILELSKAPSSVHRIFLPYFEEILLLHNNSELHNQSLYRFLVSLKSIIEDKKVFVTFAIGTNSVPRKLLSTVEHFTNVVLSVDSFSGRMHSVPYEFREYLAFFVVKKLHLNGMLASPQPKASKFGIKRDRRKLHIEALHLPPEESRAFGSASCTDQKPSLSSVDVLKETAPQTQDNTRKAQESTQERDPKDKDTTIPKSSLAASLAAARAQRASQTTSIPKPISISLSRKSGGENNLNNVDF